MSFTLHLAHQMHFFCSAGATSAVIAVMLTVVIGSIALLAIYSMAQQRWNRNKKDGSVKNTPTFFNPDCNDKNTEDSLNHKVTL